MRFSLRHAPCAHICRYCLIAESRKRSALPFPRFEALVHRFHDWRQTERRDLDIGIFVGPSFDYDMERLQGVAIPALDELCGRYGDPDNRRVYQMSRDAEGRWLDLHHRETGAGKPID